MNYLKYTLLFAIIAFTFCGCEKNETDSLNETYWEYTNNSEGILKVETFAFGSSDFSYQCNISTKNEDGTFDVETSYHTGSYSQKDRAVYLSFDNTQISDIKAKISKSGNEMIITSDKETKEFINQHMMFD